MLRSISSHIIRFAFMIMLQVLVINRLDLFDGMILPFIYIYALLMLPFETPPWMRLGIAFFVGLIIDGFMDTPGFHASSCLWLVFLQMGVQKLLAPREGYDFGQRPSIQSQGLKWYLFYISTVTLFFHLWLFLIEILSFSNFMQTLQKILISASVAIVMMLLAQFLTYSQRPKI